MVGQGALLPHPLNPGLEGRPSTLLDLVVLLPDEIHVRQLDTRLPRHPTAASSPHIVKNFSAWVRLWKVILPRSGPWRVYDLTMNLHVVH